MNQLSFQSDSWTNSPTDSPEDHSLLELPSNFIQTQSPMQGAVAPVYTLIYGMEARRFVTIPNCFFVFDNPSHVALPLMESETAKRPLHAPSELISLKAFNELQQWMSMTQKQLAKVLGISTSTVMSWKRDAKVQPRHPGIPSLIRLWAAMAAAREELGETKTRQLLWGWHGSMPFKTRLDPEETANRLMEAAEESSRKALNETSGYSTAAKERVVLEDLELAELERHSKLTEFFE